MRDRQREKLETEAGNPEQTEAGNPLSGMSLEELWRLFPIFLTEHRPVWAQWYQEEKERQERAAVKRAAASLPEKAGLELCKLWEEYNACETPEARLVKALDKAETILQHNQGANPPEFDYAFNLEYGKKYFEYDPLLRNLRVLLDEQTREKVLKQEQRR